MIIYTDGACSGNPGPGGFGVVVLDDQGNYICHHQEKTEKTTNNREELKAAIYALLKYGSDDELFAPTVYSDSNYTVMCLTNWMFNWYDHGWLKPDGNPPENLDLIKTYYNYWIKGYRINLKKIKGHAGNQWNELADQLAKGTFKNE